MSSLKRLLYCSLIAAIAILAQFSWNAHGQTPDAKPKSTGSISGHVTVGGKAAAAIVVAAFGGDTINRRAAAARTVTDNEGYYRLSGLTPSQYQIATQTPNLTTAEQGSGPSYGFVFFGSSKNIVLAAGEEVGDIDIKLVRGGVITGRITDADNKPVIEENLSLQLVDENGNPLRTNSPLPYNNQMYQTDDRGIYRIYGLPAGHYKVSIGHESGGGLASNGRGYYPRTFYADVTDPAKATIVELTEGSEAANIDIKVGSRSETYSAAGRVIDSESGLPVAGVRVTFLVASQNPERYSPMIGSPLDSRGEFRMDGLAPGHYGVYVSPEFDAGDSYSDPLYFDVVDRDITGLEIKAVRGLSISGVVVIEGDARKDALAQLAGVRISARISQSSRPQTNLSSGSTSPIAGDGTFQVNGLRPGRVSIALATFGPGVKGYSIERIEHDGLGVTQGFEIRPGQSISGLRVVLNYGTGIIRGTVRFEGGTPPAETRTFIRCTREGARDGTGAQLDSRGHFVISSLSPGTYELTLQTDFGRIQPGQRPRPPQRQLVTVTNDAEAHVSFTVDLTPKEGGP